MNDGTKLGFSILSAAVLLGAAGDLLLRPSPDGINVLMITVFAAALIAVLVRWRRLEFRGEGYCMIIPLLLSAAAVAWRDSPTLMALNCAAMMAAASIVVVRARTQVAEGPGLLNYMAYPFATAGAAVGGSLPLLFNDIDWKCAPRHSWLRECAGILRGLLIAIPLLLLFGFLFAAADGVFDHLVRNALDIDLSTVLSHLTTGAAIAWAAAGCMRRMLLKDERTLISSPPRPAICMGVTELVVALGLVDLLFLLFVVVQLRYLFGGASVIEVTPGLTYATYARSGFFQLVAVACLTLPLLLVIHHHLELENTPVHRIYQVLASAQVLMVLVIVASAYKRLDLYSAEYGLTELRFYTTAFTGLLAVVFLLFSGTVLFENRQFFGRYALAAVYLSLIILNILNPDALIVRANVNHAKAGYMFDAPYATSLSADAVPALAEALPKFRPDEKATLLWALKTRWNSPHHQDWRRWNWGRESASRAVQTLVGTTQRL